MPANLNVMTSDYVLDRPSKTIRFERDLNASGDQVFEAWTRPELVTKWWDATGKPLLRCDIDLRVGGSFAFVVEDHPEMPFAGHYREIVPGERLEFDALGAIGRVTWQERGPVTHMIVEIVCTTTEQMEQFVQMGVHVGTSATLDNLVRQLGSEAANRLGASNSSRDSSRS